MTVFASALVAVGLIAPIAAAQYGEEPHRYIDAPKKAVEIGVGIGYSQGSGEVTAAGERVSQIAGPGGEGVLDIGYRFNERWMVGGYGSFGYFNAPENSPNGVTVRGVSTGAEGQYHIRPFGRWDPYIGFGVGYRGIFSSPNDGPVTSRHGIQLARLRLGVDIRANRGFALGPVLGIDATMFTGTKNPTSTSTATVADDDLSVSPFFFAGIAGRFDIGRDRVPANTSTVAAAF
jgi:opacity protein-like surface antigen